MKKHLLIAFVLLLGSITPMAAQTKTVNVSPRVQLAREKYTERLELIKSVNEYIEDGIPNVNYTTMVRKQNWAGTGQRIDSMMFYYHENYAEEWDPYPSSYTLVIMRRIYNIGDTHYFEEYVYDDDGNPLFWFSRYGYYDVKTYDDLCELRGYFAANGDLTQTICKKVGKNGELETCALTEKFESAFESAQTNFTLFKKMFDNMYSLEYSY